jgi:HEAT repeat protein
MIKSLLRLIILICVLTAVPSKVMSATEENQKAIRASFDTISQALFNEKIHVNMKVDIFEMLSKMTVSEKKYSEGNNAVNDFYNELISNPYDNSYTIDIMHERNKKDKKDIEPDYYEKLRHNKYLIGLLEKVLNDDNENMVLYALDIISKAKIVELKEPIIKRLNEINQENSDLISSMLTTLGDIGDEKTINIIHKYLGSEDLKVKLNALQALAEIKCDRSNEILKAYLSNDSLELALLSAGILAADGDEEALELLEEGARSPVLLTQQKTLIAMSNTTAPEVIPVLKIALKSDNEAIKAYALEILSGVKSQEVPFIVENYLDDESLLPRALIALDKNVSPEAINIMRKCINSDSKIKKTYALAILSQMKDNGAIPVLKEALNDKYENIRCSAAKILYSMGDHSGVKTLEEALDSDNYDLALSSAIFLGYNNHKSSVDFLKNALNNQKLPSWKRLDVAIILEKLDDKTVIPTMKEMLARQRPASLPKDISPSEETLLEFLKDNSLWVKLNSSVFLVRDKNEKCLETLKELADYDDLKVRAIALKLIGNLGSVKALPFLEQKLKSDSVRARVNAAEAIIMIIINNS